MSVVPPPLPLIDTGSSAISPKPHVAHLIILWLIILGSVALRVTLHYFPPPGQKTSSTHAFSALQLEIIGRYMVGAHALVPTAVAPKITEFQAALEKQAGNDTTNQIRAIIIEGELSGATFASDKLRLPRPLSSVTLDQRQDIQTLLQLYQNGAASLDAPSRTRLLTRYDWFAQLALSYGLPAGDPDRAAAITPAYRTLVSLLAIMLLSLAALAAGVVLLIIAIVFLARKSIRPRFAPSRQPDIVFLEMFTLYLGGMILISAAMYIMMWTGWQPPNAASWLILVVLPLPLAWPFIRGMPWSTTAQHFGLFAPRGILREIGAGLTGYVTGLPIIALGMLITYILALVTGIRTAHPITFEVKGGRWMILQLFFLASIWAPITEELMFRGVFFAHLRNRFGWLVSAGIVALIFAAVHPYDWIAIPTLASIAMVLAGIREWRGSIFGCITAHALHNTLVMILLVLILG